MRHTTTSLILAAVLLGAPARATEFAPATQPATGGVATTQPAPAVPHWEPIEFRAFRTTQTWIHAPIVLEAAQEWGLSPFLLLALLWAESRLDCTRVNPRSRACGCGQFTRTGIRGFNRIRAARGDDRTFTRADAFDPHKGIHATAEMLAHLVERYGVRGGAAAYNGGRHKRAFANHVLRKLRALRLAAGLPPVEMKLSPELRPLVAARS